METSQDKDNTENKHDTVLTVTTKECSFFCHLSCHARTFFYRYCLQENFPGDKIRRVYELLFLSWFLREGKPSKTQAIVHNVTIAQWGCPHYTHLSPACHTAMLDIGMASKGEWSLIWSRLLLPLAVLFYNTFCALPKINICVDFTLSLPAFPPAPPAILNQEKRLSNRSFTLRWEEPDDKGRPILRYLVFYRELYVNEWKQKNVSTNLCTLTLKWAKIYEFTVVAENDQGRSNKSKKENFTVIPGEFLDTFIRIII